MSTWRSCRTAGEFRERGREHIDSWAERLSKIPPSPHVVVQTRLAQQQDWFERGPAITLEECFALIDGSGLVNFDYPIEVHEGVTFVDLNRLKQGTILKVDTDFLPIAKRMTPWFLRGGKLYRTVRRESRNGAVSYYDLPCHHVPLAFQYKERGEYLSADALKVTATRSGDWLDWRAVNLYIPAVYQGCTAGEVGEAQSREEVMITQWHCFLARFTAPT